MLTAEIARALLHGQANDVLDRLCQLARLATRTPVAVVGVVEAEHLQLVSQFGVPEPWRHDGRLPLDAFGEVVPGSGDVLALEDIARHPLADRVPQLQNFPRLSCCAAPIRVKDEIVAVLAVSDVRPRRWTAEDIAVLRGLAATGVRDLERLSRSRGDRSSATAIGARPAPAAAAPSVLDGPEPPEDRLDPEPDDPTQPPATALNGSGSESRAPESQEPEPQEPESREAASPDVPRPPSLDSVSARVAESGTEARADAGRAAYEAGAEQMSEAKYRTLFIDSSTPLFVMAADTTLLEVNRACEELLDRDRSELYRTRLADLSADADVFDRVRRELAEQGSVRDAEVVLKCGTEHRTCQLSAGVQVIADGVMYHGAIRDVTAARRTQEELVRSALHDPLTSLPNRVVFMDRLGRLLQQSRRRGGTRFAVLFLDLDDFKAVNDTYGHLAGDRLLAAVAHRLEGCVRQEDTIARLGGDEFGILLATVLDAASVILVADRIRESLARAFEDEGVDVGMSASIGIALSVTGYERAEDLIRDADAAMYRAKAAESDDYVIFDHDMHARALAQRQLEDDLRAAVERDELAVHYHPVVELDNGSVAGLEALIRWTHPERGVLLPSEFMPLAERSGLIVEIGWWVLRAACAQLREWQREYPRAAGRLTMSVNLSAKQFSHPALIPQIDSILDETGLDPRCLRLDVTEAVVMQNATSSARLLHMLRERGIQICLDDFGTGYSSLRQLREFPISTLKIDRSFVGNLSGDDPDAREIVQGILALGRSMAIDAVAEGVETPEQLEQLRRLGARFAQGFLFSLPLDPAAAAELLAGNG